jgi:hypothetical protein
MRYKVFLVAWLVLAAVAAQAQNYAIDWYTIDGGGGSSAGGIYAVSGTIGQPDAGSMSGGNFSLEGGFWGVIAALQSPGGPFLRVELSGTNTVIVAWPDPSTGFNLQQNLNLGTTNWTAVTNLPVITGGEKQVIVAPPAGNRYFRLKSP